MNLYFNFILRDNKMADFESRQFEIGLKFVRCSFAERNNFSEGSSELNKDTQVIRVRGSAAPRVFKLKLLVFDSKRHFNFDVPDKLLLM